MNIPRRFTIEHTKVMAAIILFSVILLPGCDSILDSNKQSQQELIEEMDTAQQIAKTDSQSTIIRVDSSLFIGPPVDHKTNGITRRILGVY